MYVTLLLESKQRNRRTALRDINADRDSGETHSKARRRRLDFAHIQSKWSTGNGVDTRTHTLDVGLWHNTSEYATLQVQALLSRLKQLQET